MCGEMGTSAIVSTITAKSKKENVLHGRRHLSDPKDHGGFMKESCP